MRAAVIAALVACGPVATADNFSAARYDPGSGRLVITMRYRGSNPDHNFTLKWGECKARDGKLPDLAVEVLDDQFRDRALQEFKKTVSFDLGDMPCRPAQVTLRTAPRYYYTLVIPR